jgi:hypothetical protein
MAAYIENHPVKAGVVCQAEEYRWASCDVARQTGPARRRQECRRGTQKCVRHGHRSRSLGTSTIKSENFSLRFRGYPTASLGF